MARHEYVRREQARSQPPPPEAPEQVTLAEVSPVTFQQTVTAVGTVVAHQWISLKTEVSGKITDLPITSGQTVQAGDVLLKLDTSVERPTLEMAEVRLKLAEANLERTNQLYQSKSVSESELERAQAAKAELEADIERLRATIAKKTVVAPFVARVGLINVSVGQYLTEGTAITTLQGIDKFVYVDFMVPQLVADQIEIHQPVTFQHADQTLSGKVIAWDSESDKVTRNMRVRAELHDPPSTLSPNDAIRVTMDYGPPVQAHAIPPGSLRRTPQGAHVFVVEKDNSGQLRAFERTVLPGRFLGDRLVIMSGLTEGDRVVVDGSFKLRPNFQGILITDKPPKGTP